MWMNERYRKLSVEKEILTVSIFKKEMERFAQMVANGFKEVHERFALQEQNTNRQFAEVRQELFSHQTQIDLLRDDVRQIKNFLGIPKKE
jgi:hypothetical protein